MRYLAWIVLILFSLKGFGQADSTKSAFSLSGYLETYYLYDLSKPNDHNRPAFVYSHTKHNEFNVNLGFVKASYETDQVRAQFALATGTYMNANYVAEQGVLKNIYEAHGGIKISSKKNLWIDVGIFPSHIGFESAVGLDNWTQTRGIYAENSPYFETGVKITYTTDNDKWLISGLLLNGWQRIQRVDGNNTPAFGHQLTYKPNSKITLNSSSFIGNDKADSLRQMRYFHNFYGIVQLTEKIGITVGFDIGVEQKSRASKRYDTWYAPVVIVQYCPAEKHQIAVRTEYYRDKKGVMIDTGTPNGFKTWGYSVNYDYLMRKNVRWRVEGRGMTSQDPIFTWNDKLKRHNFFIATSLAFAF